MIRVISRCRFLALTIPPSGVRVVDAATVYGGPMIATLLGEFGADAR